MRRSLSFATAVLVSFGALAVDPPAAKAPAATTPKKPAKKAAKKSPKQEAPKMITTASGLKYLDTVVGTGDSPAKGQQCVMHYTGWLWVNEAKGSKFDSSVDRGQPFTFTLGVGQVIKGWDEGVISMKVGGKRTLYIPSYLGYGPRGAGGDIPPNADLIFDVELVALK